MSQLHVVFTDDFGNAEQRDVAPDGHVVPLRLFDLNALYRPLFRAIEAGIGAGLNAGTVTSGAFHHWHLV
jgi:hypothetical protein